MTQLLEESKVHRRGRRPLNGNSEDERRKKEAA